MPNNEETLDLNRNILTREGQRELESELKRLIEVDRPAVIAEIKEAREQGDLSENAEFDAAREKQGTIEDRIRDIENILANSTVLSTAALKRVAEKVRIGSTVAIKDLSTNSDHSYTIVGSLEANPFEARISNVSPLALALLGHVVGDVVTVDAASAKYGVRIVGIK